MHKIKCNICQKSCRPKSLPDSYCKQIDAEPMEFIKLEGRWGYYSENPNRDLEYHCCTMCQPCYEKVKRAIESIGGEIIIKHYNLWNGHITDYYDKLDELADE